ncbi:MAG TPA: phytochelatin synthase family protein [Rickettsiales bacterium]|nr:phytochelatin synthase family protein [Rickettsiales bacterium]
MRLVLFILSVVIAWSEPLFAADLINFDSAEGMKRLERSQAKVDFFPLANHFESQENKLFCGVASSVIVLNTLRLHNPAYAKPQDNALLSKAERRYMPKGFDPIYHRYSQDTLLNSHTKSRMAVLGKPVQINGKPVSDYGLQLSQLAALLRSYGLDVTERVADASLSDLVIRKELTDNLQQAGDYVLVNYSRKALGQEELGHISPLGAYDAQSDSFLVLDVNSMEFNWVWVPANDLIAAMRTFDTVENRGYLLVQEGKLQK